MIESLQKFSIVDVKLQFKLQSTSLRFGSVNHSGTSNENIVQNNLIIALLNVF